MKTRTDKILQWVLHLFGCPFSRGWCCCLWCPGRGGPPASGLHTHSRSVRETPHCFAPRNFASHPLPRCFQHQCLSRLLQEPTALRLWVSWPTLLDVSIPPVLTSKLTLFSLSPALAYFPLLLLILVLREVCLKDPCLPCAVLLKSAVPELRRELGLGADERLHL